MRIQMGNILLDENRRRALCNGQDLSLTRTEYNFMKYLLNHRQETVPREVLLKEVWGYQQVTETRATDDMVKRVRRKLTEKGANIHIGTLRGIGFYIEEKPSPQE